MKTSKSRLNQASELLYSSEYRVALSAYRSEIKGADTVKKLVEIAENAGDTVQKFRDGTRGAKRVAGTVGLEALAKALTLVKSFGDAEAIRGGAISVGNVLVPEYLFDAHPILSWRMARLETQAAALGLQFLAES